MLHQKDLAPARRGAPARAVMPAEKRSFADARTGATVWQMTDAAAMSHTPYFLNCPWIDGGRAILFVSYRDGRPNLYRVDEASGEIRQLTDRDDVHPWSACVGLDDRLVFYTAGPQLRVVDTQTAANSLVFEAPDGFILGNCDRSPDGTAITTCASEGIFNHLLVIQTDGSGYRDLFETTELLAHAQFSPNGRSILYSSNLPRLRIVDTDGRNNRVLRPQGHREWITHESWLSDDEVIFCYWPHDLRAIRADGSGERIISTFNAWHANARPDGSLIACDTTLPDIGIQLVDPRSGERRTLCYPDASSLGYQWSKPEPLWVGDDGEKAYGPQWSHPHPCFSPDGRKLAFTSDRTGQSQVYVAMVT